LTDKQCIQLRALSNFKDVYGIDRKAGSEWLITNKNAEVHIIDVHEELVSI